MSTLQKLPRLSRSRRDQRLKAVIAVDPELSTSLAVDRLAAVAIPVEVINLGQPGSIAAGLDAWTLATSAPQIGYTTVPNATQFSAFSICTAKGAAILAEDGGNEAICNSDLDVGRGHIHTELASLIAGFLKRHLGSLRSFDICTRRLLRSSGLLGAIHPQFSWANYPHRQLVCRFVTTHHMHQFESVNLTWTSGIMSKMCTKKTWQILPEMLLWRNWVT